MHEGPRARGAARPILVHGGNDQELEIGVRCAMGEAGVRNQSWADPGGCRPWAGGCADLGGGRCADSGVG